MTRPESEPYMTADTIQFERIREDQRRMFEDVARLREAKAGQDVMNRNLQDDLTKLTEAVQTLTSTIDRSRGALWVISGAAGAMGAFISAAVALIIHGK